MPLSSYFSAEWPEPFQHFDAAHCGIIISFLLLCLVVVLIGLRGIDTLKILTRQAIIGALVLSVWSWQTWLVLTGQWTIRRSLPLHICGTLGVITPLMLWMSPENHACRFLFDFEYFLGLGGTIQSIFTPTVEHYGWPHFRVVQFMILHISIILAVIYMMVVHSFRPHFPSSIVCVVVWTNVWLFVIGSLNVLLGSNYVWLMEKPPSGSLYDVMGPWPWYLVTQEVIGVMVIAVLYIPWLVVDWVHGRSIWKSE